MKVSLKRIALASSALALAAVLQVFGPKLLRAAYNDDTASGLTNLRTGNVKITDTGVYDSGGTIRYQPGSDNHFTGNLSNTGGQQSMGSINTILSTSSASGSSAGHIFYALLASGPNSIPPVEGSVLVATTTASNSVTVMVAQATNNLTTVVGVAAAAASTGAVVGVYNSGWVLARTTGTVLPGDNLVSSSYSQGYLASQGQVAVSSGMVAISLTTGNSAGGMIRVRLK